jgi:hypothetical protein
MEMSHHMLNEVGPVSSVVCSHSVPAYNNLLLSGQERKHDRMTAISQHSQTLRRWRAYSREKSFATHVNG